jgi:hypothetical protein
VNADIEVRVRCSGRLHRIALTYRGPLVLLDHPDLKTVETLAALAGEEPRCLQVLRAWRKGWCYYLPRQLWKAWGLAYYLRCKRQERKVLDLLHMPWPGRAYKLVQILAAQAIQACDYRRPRGRWREGGLSPEVDVLFPSGGVSTPRIAGFRVRESDGSYVAVVQVALPRRWLRLAWRGMATALDPQGRRVFVLDVLQENPLIVLAGRQGRGYSIHPAPARLEGGRLKWL